MDEQIQPVEQAKEAAQPVEEVVTEEPVTEAVEDRSAFACDACKGEGIGKDNTQFILCSQCQGTGKGN